MNYFEHRSAAERYARDRPSFHPLVIDRVRASLKFDRLVPVALDVGCGTGMSSVALTEIAAKVIATDVSAAMLAHAPPNPRIEYLKAPAEALPVESGSVDLVSVILAFWYLRPTLPP